MTQQLSLALEPTACPTCGSTRHHGCGYDPEMVRPAMSVADAVSLTIKRAVEEHGWDEAKRRIPGLRTWDELSDDERERTRAER